MSSKPLWQRGENRIVEYLTGRGWSILERNYRFLKKEVDIIARRDNLVIFVEVKARKTARFGFGMEAVDGRKQSHIALVASHYMTAHRLHECACRFDVASIDGESFTYIEDAFRM